MAKAEFKKVEAPWLPRLGHVVERCFKLAGRSQKEAAGLLQRDAAQIARWCAGTERPQIDVVLGVEEFQQPFVIALAAEVAGEGVTVETIVRVKRTV